MDRLALAGCVIALTVLAERAWAQPPATSPGARLAQNLPEPRATPAAVKFAKVIGWPEGRTPKAPAGFQVVALARLESPRWIYVLPGGDVLIAQSRTLPKPEKQEPDPAKKAKQDK